jgi:hypothetical protein
MIATWNWIAGGAREGDKRSRNRRQHLQTGENYTANRILVIIVI